MTSIFQVKNDIKSAGFAYAFYHANKSVGILKALYLLFIANHMIKFEQKQFDTLLRG